MRPILDLVPILAAVALAAACIAVPFSVLAEKKRFETQIDGKAVVATWRPGVASALDDGSITGDATWVRRN
jgi:hypothetical protein